MKIEGSVALVTGANRGIGKAFVKALVEAKAARIYATARNPESLEEIIALARDRIIPLTLDITQPEQVAAAVRQAPDVNLLINNAGVLHPGSILAPDSLEMAEQEMQVIYFGTLRMMQALLPILQQNNGGVIVNIISIGAIVSLPPLSSYSAAKAALYTATRSARLELAEQNTKIIGVFPGPVDTDMTAGGTMPKVAPSQIACKALEAVEQEIEDVYPDAIAESVFSDFLQPFQEVDTKLASLLSAS